MTTDYSKKTNAELVEILKTRSLPHTGKKAELVARIQESDEKAATGDSAAAPAEDVIDWDDDMPAEVPAESIEIPQASTEAGANAIAAGGEGAVANPVAVPNQTLDTDPATTNDLTVEAAGQPAPAAEPEAEKKPAVDYTRGLPATELEEELRKRKARAEKFGIVEDSETALKEAEKTLARAKRFGTGTADADTDTIKGLDQALPDEKTRKRGRNDQGGRGGKRRDQGQGQGRNRNRRGNGNQNQNQNQNQNKSQNQNRGGNNNASRVSSGQNAGRQNGGVQKSWSSKDTAAMEARKKRFAAAA
ncbi:DNA-binding SAP [Penicillium malachiteum]|uniref:DNA-binding SAP n=1 Tax=Penicillium malachiteum TaxID=1324776 RepID=UPI0025496374|nr:DNA-binding SAP [Penicillium malachiteum]KAJ5721905.1 DNA-binding SAP [Penicillium malachiteum]